MSRRRLFVIALAAIVFFAVCGAAYVWSNRATAAPAQPIAFRHRNHAEAGVQCMYCHSSAMRSDIASIPSVQKCMGCHQTIAADREPIKLLKSYWERQEPIRWERVTPMIDFVYFSHQPHLGAGVNCETCHGDVGKMTTARQQVNMDMGWCLDCHLKQPGEKAARLADCLLCHK